MAGANAAPSAPGTRQDANVRMFNTYIYDYLLKNKQFTTARAFYESGMPLSLEDGRSRDVHANGVDENGMDADHLKDDGHDLPHPKQLSGEPSDNSMLFEWWCIFWDMFQARQNSSSVKIAGGEAMAYLQSIAPNRTRGDSVSGMRQVSTPVGPGQMPQMHRVMPQNQQQLMMMQMKKYETEESQLLTYRGQPGQLKMAQEDVNGRPQSPASVDNAPSPSKRQRLNGNQFGNPQLAPNGRVQPPTPGGQPMAQSNSQGMLGGQVMDSESLAAMQRPGGKMVYMPQNGMAMQNMQSIQQAQNRLMNQGPNQGSPQIMGAGGQDAEFYAMSQQPGMRQPGVGNHQGALQDYQMQLMLLEQQNKKRLLQAQQTNADGTGPQNGMPPDGALPHFQMPQGMSPQTNRPGPSPNPVEQMKRTNTKGQPGSPVPDGAMQQRNSPAGMNFNGQMPADPSFYMKNMPEQNGVQMRPPSSYPQGFNPQMAAQMAGAGRGQGQPQNWPQQMVQPMQPGVQPGQNMGTPRMNPAMPPPSQIPAPGNANRTQPSSPQPNAPPTPQPAKAAAAKKKDTKDRKRPAKKQSAASINAATPSADAAEPPQTPLSNPNTPHAQGFAQKNGPPQSMAPNAPMPVPGPIPEASMGSFMGQDDYQNMDMGFGPMDSENVLENFDFDSFLNTGDESGGLNFGDFNGNFETSGAVEAGPDA